MTDCWEFKNCGRQPGGSKIEDLGPCPAATDTSSDGLNGGKNGGRSCWATTGTFCGGIVQGSYAQKLNSCLSCDFYKMVKQEEGRSFELLTPTLSKSSP